MTSFWCIIPAAGIGSRMGSERPKQYLELAGSTVLEQTLSRFLAHPGLLGLVLCLAQNDRYWATLPLAAERVIHRVSGGRERADSVLNGLQALQTLGAGAEDWVLVHDAARPNLSRADLDRLLTALADDPVGGLLGVPAQDTLKQVDQEGRVLRTLDRTTVWQAYTPQMFRFSALQTAITDALQRGLPVTDEASAMEAFGFAPRLIEGRADNIKITRPEDLHWLRQIWNDRSQD